MTKQVAWPERQGMVSSVQDIAIIGAGPAGLAAAWALGQEGGRVVVFEKSRGVSGRAATRRRGPIRFDHGANFFRTTDPEVQHLIHELLPTDQLVEIPGEVWTFDREGTIAPGDPAQNAEAKYSYREGISTLGKLLAAASGAEVRLQREVSRLERRGARWEVLDTSGTSGGEFDSVLVTAPAPQAARLVEASAMDDALRSLLKGALRVAPYHSQFSFVLGYAQRLSLAKRFHALVNTDGGHPVAWLSFEDDKMGHVPEGQSVVVVQMAPSWSASRLEHDREELLGEVLASTRALLPELGAHPEWWDSQRWMLAHPAKAVEDATLRRGEAEGLYFAGDGVVGRGRVALALKSGLETAQRMGTTAGERTDPA